MSPGSIGRCKTLWSACLFLLLLTTVLLPGCGSTATTTTGAVTATTAGGAVQVIMSNRAYDPQEITIKVGDTVTWVNQDAPRHDVVAENGEFKSDLFSKGETFSHTFTKAGTYPYYCSIHPGMTGTVIVQ